MSHTVRETSDVTHRHPPAPGRRTSQRLRPAIGVLVAFAAGCQYHAKWPEHPFETRATDSGATIRSYRIGRAAAPNYFQRIENGRVTAVAFDDDDDGLPDETVEIRGEHDQWPHFIIVLDGVPFDVVQAMYEEGHFRLFAPPVRVVSVFPAMTDVALSRLFHTDRCIAIEASYFDRARNTLSSGNDVYLSGKNTPWTRAVDYHAPQRVAVQTYLRPWSVFSDELRAMHRLFNRTDARTAVAYSVGTAGLGTRGGEKAIRDYLRDVEKLCERITYDRRGRVRFSLLADHGHSLVPCRFISFRKTLTNAGFNVTKSLRQAHDIVMINYGIVTCAQFYTDRPRSAAAGLVAHPAVDLAMFRDGDAVIVQSARAIATVRKRGDGFSYDMSRGDPLELADIIERLRRAGNVRADGTIQDRALLEATANHRYPDPLHRVWTCFDGLVEQPPDVIVSLKPQACYGSKFFHFFVAPVASTHGSLDYRGSVTFLLTNASHAPLPPVMRIEDVLETIRDEHPATSAPTTMVAPNSRCSSRLLPSSSSPYHRCFLPGTSGRPNL